MSKFPIFDPICPFLSLFVLNVSLSKYVRFNELPPPLSQKKFHDIYEFSNEKLGGEKEEKNYFFC